VGKPEGKRPLGRPRRRWEDGIRIDLREIGLGGCGLDSTVSGQGPVADCCECGDEPSGYLQIFYIKSMLFCCVLYNSVLAARTLSSSLYSFTLMTIETF
jgi:hypothetical protein